jgi:prepilin-type N-terminal cleavage/methylation domain-containing protein
MTDHNPSVRNSESGFTLIELAIALVIFAIVLASLGRTSIAMAHQATQSGSVAMRNAEMSRQVNRLEALTWDSLPARAGCVSIGTGAFPHQRCVTLTTITPTRTSVRLIITPTLAPIRADTTTFERSKIITISPFGAP